MLLRKRWLFVTAFIVLGTVALHAQVDTGSISGQIIDPTGAYIPGARITLRGEATNSIATGKSDSKGNYFFSPVQVGLYTLTVEQQGFSTQIRSHVRVDIQQGVELNFTLRTGEVQQTIDVSSTNVPLLQTESSSVGQVVEARQINDLPLNGRNYFFLAQLAAGVTTAQEDKRGEDSNGRFAANGARPTENDYLLDGIDNNSSVNSIQNGKDFVIQTPVDALSEFKVQTNNYSAEFGRSAGAILNATVKTGTNSLHGDAWEFLRNQNLDANDYFANQAGLPRSEFHRNQFGGTLGGPVRLPRLYDGRNKTFFFVDYEGTRINQGNTMTATVPTNAERDSGYLDFSDLIPAQSGTYKDAEGRVYPAGTIFNGSTTRQLSATGVDPLNGKHGTPNAYVRDPFSSNMLPSSRVDPNAVLLLNLLPRANGPGVISNYVVTKIFKDNTNSFDVRIDQNIGQNDRFFARYSSNDHHQLHSGPFTGYADGGDAQAQAILNDHAQNVAIGETHIFSSHVVNDVRIGVNREAAKWLQPYSDTPGINEQFEIQGVPQTPGNGGLTKFIIGDLTNFGSASSLPSEKFGTTPQINDDLTFVHGQHAMKYGFEAQRIIVPFLQPPNARGVFNYNGLFTSVVGQKDASTAVAMMLLRPTAADPLSGPTNTKLSNAQWSNLIRSYYAGYFQDDWKVTEHLTLNLGLRYDYYSFPHDRRGLAANFLPGPNRVGGTYLVTPEVAKIMPANFINTLSSEGITTQTTGEELAHAQPLNFAPRFGFAFQATRRLVLRGGYGISYGGVEANVNQDLITSNFPIADTVSLTTTNPEKALSNNGSIGSLETNYLNISLDPATVTASGIALVSMAQDWKTTYTESMNLMVEYELHRDLSLTIGYVGSEGRHIVTTIDANAPTELLVPGTATTNFLPYPKTAATGDNVTGTNGSSSYNSLQITLEKHLSHGFNFLTNYTYQKTLTTSHDPLENDIGSYRAPYLLGLDNTKADFNVPQVFHFSGTWQIPFGRSLHGFAKAAGYGWSFNGIATAQEGQPITVGCPRATTVTGFTCHAIMAPGVNPYAHSSVSHFLNAAAFINPNPVAVNGQSDASPLGSLGAQVNGPPFRRIDASLFKRFDITHRVYTEFRFEVFNVTNTANFSAPSNLDFTNSQFGQITATRDSPNDPREIQLAAKVYW